MARTPTIDPKVVASELKETLKLARKKDLNFALLIAKDGMVLEAHPTKGSSVMRRQAKAKGAGPKGTEGVMNVSGKTINFKVEDDDFPGTLPKTTKKWLTSMGIQMKVLITLPGGVTLDDGEEDEQTSADTLGGAEDNPPDLPPDACLLYTSPSPRDRG